MGFLSGDNPVLFESVPIYLNVDGMMLYEDSWVSGFKVIPIKGVDGRLVASVSAWIANSDDFTLP